MWRAQDIGVYPYCMGISKARDLLYNGSLVCNNFPSTCDMIDYLGGTTSLLTKQQHVSHYY